MVRACLAALVVLAGTPAVERDGVVAGLQSWLDRTSTLEMKFRQSLVSGALGTSATESGRLYLERPGKVRWDYLDPEKKIALLLGDRTALYLDEDRQLTRSRLRDDQGMFPRLIAGRDRIDELFTASVIATPSGGGRGSYRLRLVPKGASAALGEVTLTLRPPAFSIEAAELVDEAGNRTTYTFSDVRRNRALPERLFAFEPPPGTEVVDE